MIRFSESQAYINSWMRLLIVIQMVDTKNERIASLFDTVNGEKFRNEFTAELDVEKKMPTRATAFQALSTNKCHKIFSAR